MGYIEHLQAERISEFVDQLEELKGQEDEEKAFCENSFLISFAYDYKTGLERLKVLNKSLRIYRRQIRQQKQKVLKWKKGVFEIINKDTSIDNAQKKKLKQEISDIVKKTIKESNEKIVRLRKIKEDLLLRLFNWCTYILMILASFVIFTAVDSRYEWIKILGYVAMFVTLIWFVVRQILYTVEYLRAINATRQGTILYCIKRGFSTLLIVWWYLSTLVFINNWNIKISTYSFVSICAIAFISEIYDFFLSSSYFDEPENAIALVAATMIGIVMVMNLVKSESVKVITGWILFTACLLLSMLTIKKFLIDKSSVDSLPKVLFVVSLLIIIVVMTILSLYLTLWKTPKEGQVVDNSLFSAAVGVYAALLGGGLTLAGVAWTIKNTAKEKADEERKKAKPLFVTNMVFENIDARKEKVCFDEKDDTTSYVCHVIAEIENSKNSGFTMSQVYHDAQWRKIEGNSVILPDKKVYFDFLFTEDVNNLFLEVKDCLGNSYFYEIKVLQWTLLTGVPASSSCIDHTIKELKEITLEDINERITKEVK